jgi:NADH-quinone oxidoreductase subunit G
VGALGSKDFLYTQRVWYLQTRDGVCPGCSTGCSTHVDVNKDIVYRLRGRENKEAQGWFLCDEGRYGFHYVTRPDRIIKPKMMDGGTAKPASWTTIHSKLFHALSEATLMSPRRVVVVLSPFLTLEEAFALAAAFKKRSDQVRLVLGPVPVVGEDDHYPKDVKGNAVTPTKFTIRAEKCPNRVGVEAVLRHFEGAVLSFEAVQAETPDLLTLWFAGGYPDAAMLRATAEWKLPPTVVVQDFFESPLTKAATYVLPATTAFEKDGTFVNHAGLAQTFPRATRPPQEAQSELQLAWMIAGRKGLATAATVRKEIAATLPAFAELAVEKPTATGKKLELVTV